ncbi:MAG: glycosyltransferase, partial [Acidimicrobiales bacterium]
MGPLRFSVVINTDNRAASLALTLQALRHLDHRAFEVIVVRGPTPDATDEVVARHGGVVKLGRCPERNLSMSRNIGIAMATGDVVAFIDDDAYPDPAWLDRLEDAFGDPEVVGVGGPVWDWSGARLQVLHSWANRLGDVWVDVDWGVDQSYLLARPGTSSFTYPIGTNASFLRHRLVELGGFDEQFDYGWDEVDLCHRFIDGGWVIRIVEDAFVYHKSRPSAIRGENRATHNMGVLLKNKAYYTFKHGWGVVPLAEIADSLSGYAQHYRDEIGENVEKGLLTPADLDQYEADVVAGFDLGQARWAEGIDRRRPAAWFSERERPFAPFPALRARADKLHLCFFTVEYPPEPVNGIGRVVHELATGLGRRGHEVHVLTRGADLDRIDFEDDVWVHRLVTRSHPLPEGLDVTAGLWNYAATLRDEALRIHASRPLDLVQAPNWSTEGIAVLADGRLPLVVGLYSPLATVADLDSPLAAGRAGGDPEVPTLIELERLTYRQAPHFLACGHAIVEEIERAYDVALGDRVGFVPHGIADRAGTVEPETWPGR